MNKQLTLFTVKRRPSRLRVLGTGDPKTLFRDHKPAEIYEQYGAPARLLTTSAKSLKTEAVGVLNRILFFTPGIFCPAATAACREACLSLMLPFIGGGEHANDFSPHPSVDPKVAPPPD